MANNKITLKGLKAKTNKQLYCHLMHNGWEKEIIIDMLKECDIEVEDGLNLKQLVERYHDDICELIFEEYLNSY